MSTESTGEFLPEEGEGAKQGQPQTPGPDTGQATEILPSANPAPSGPEQADGTQVLPPESAAVSVTGVYLPEEAAAPGGTGIYEPDAAAATGGHNPAATRLPAKQATQDKGPVVPGATGAYAPGDPGGPGNVPGDTHPMAATGDFDPHQPAASRGPGPTPANGSLSEANRCGRYVLKHFHARGGMGEIWLAEDPAIGRPVALKRMLGHRPDQQRRFQVEAQVTGQLEHPGIVPVHELGTNEKGQPFYTMKFVRGRTLQKVIAEYHEPAAKSANREVAWLRLLQVFVSLCQTVAYAHSRGVLHRDLKPENVMLGPYGETLLLDWGIAKVMDQPELPVSESESAFVHLNEAAPDTGTRAGSIMGSPNYMAPEVAAGLNSEVDQRSDVYLLGGTLYEILTGQVPRKGGTVLEMLTKAQRQPPPPPRQVNPAVPRALEAICLQAMALRQADRYQTALALAEDVQRFVAGEPVSAYREGFVERAARWVRRHRKALTRVAGAVLLVGLLLFGWGKWREAEDRHLMEVQELEEGRRAAAQEAERLKEQQQARHDLAAFRRLADEARFYAATTDPVSEQSPYFDPREGARRIQAALALAGKWGPDLQRLPLPAEGDGVKKEQYDLLLLLAQSKSQPGATAQAARETLALLDEAARVRAPTRSYYQLRSRLHEQLGERKQAAQAQQQAQEPGTPVTSLDHFLLGEQHRKEAAGLVEGETQQKAGRADVALTEQAIAAYREALGKDPEHYWSHLQLGRCHLSVGRYAEAVEALGACVALRPDSPWAYSIRGSALALLKRYPEAERDLNRAVELSPESRPARLNRGLVFWAQKRNAEALADFEAVLQPPKEKQLVEAAYYRGQLYLQQGQVQKALDDFDRVVAENPNFRPVYPHRARIHIAQGNQARALADLDAYLAGRQAVDRRGWQVHGQRGRLLRLLYTELPPEQRRKPAGQALAALALGELREAVNRDAQAAEVFDDLGAMLELLGQLNEAIAAYDKGLKLAPKDVKLLNKRGWALSNSNQNQKALADFSAAIAVEPENAEAHSGLGYVQALQKLPPEAQQQAELALLHGTELRAPDNYLNLHNVACIYAALSAAGDKQASAYQDVAMALLRRAVRLWQKEGTNPNEIDLIKGDSTFKPLSGRDDFQELIGLKPPKKPQR